MACCFLLLILFALCQSHVHEEELGVEIQVVLGHKLHEMLEVLRDLLCPLTGW